MTASCPRCRSASLVSQGSEARPGRFRCKHCGYEFTDQTVKLKDARILSIDIETLPPKYYSWSPKPDYLSRPMMIQDWSLLSFSAKWLGEDRIISSVLTPEEAVARDDRRLSILIWSLLDYAFIANTHNGRRFDIKKINTRFWKHKLHKPSHYKVIDTLVTVQTVFDLTYNSMDYVAEYMERERKLDTDMGLWIAADHGNPNALKTILEYNDQDVIVQEQMYLDVREWIPNHPNLTLYNNHNKKACPVCLQKGYKQIGFHYTNKKKYPEYRCNHCSATWHDSKAIKH